MKYFFLLLSLAVSIGLTYTLNTKLGDAPPFGKFLNPFTGFWQNAESKNFFTDEIAELPGLKDEVQVYFDERLVPHVYAKNDEDLYYMQGYLTARFRLWQMEISTHAAAGRVSEIVGEKGLSNDRLMRRIGMTSAAEEAADYIKRDEQSHQLIHAYCNGVNAYINKLKPKDYPLEYKLLNYSPEEWQPVKVALLLKNMANMLSIFEYDIENHNFITKYGEAAFRQLYPDFIADEDPIIPVGTPYPFKPDTFQQSLSSLPVHEPVLYSSIIEKPDEITGSNNWAVSGSKTKSGKPILCNDPHLRLSLPSIWYEMHLVSPSMNVYGATLPGSPCVIIGFNDSIAWGVTNAGRDVRDWYRVKFKDDARNEYYVNGQWKPTTKRKEVYKVKGKEEFVEEVVYTEFGPVVYDEQYDSVPTKKQLAMRWTAHLPSNEFKTFYLMNQGKNYDDYLNALNHYTCPAQNFVFASRSGDIAIKEQGRFPLRNKQTEQGKFISDGETTADLWNGFIPYEHNPTIKNPGRGFVSSANQHPTDSSYPYYYPGVGVYENYRNRRINQLLAENNGIDAAFMKKMQDDNLNLHAKEAVPVLLDILKDENLSKDEKNIVEKLSDWDYFNNADQVAPVYFEIWWNELRKWLWDETSNNLLPMKQPGFYVTVQFLKTDSTSAFYDVLHTPGKEDRKKMVRFALQQVPVVLKEKKFTEVSEPYGTDETLIKDDMNPTDWGTYKDTRIEHLARLEPFSALHVYNGGNLGIVNATNSTHGPSWRMIVDFGDMKSYVVYPGGQSGNPGSHFYKTGIEKWAKGEYFTANFASTPDQLKDKKLFTATYKPAR